MPHLPSLADAGYLTLFLWVFLEQAGLPIPAVPILVGAGVLAAAGRLNLGLCFAVAVAAALAADVGWFYLGRARGSRILNLVCRVSWKPDRCITATTTLFGKYGDKTLLFAKFIPGLGTLAPPLAGMARISLARFAAFDGAGSALWAAVPLAAGRLLQRLPAPASLVAQARAHLPLLVALVLLGFVAWRVLWRLLYRLQLRRERAAGVSAGELRALLDAEAGIAVVDVRHSLSVRQRPFAVPTALRIGYKELPTRYREIPADGPVFVYCDCPADEGALAAVLRLRKLGLPSARILRGGLDAWVEGGFATVPVEIQVVNTP